MTNKAVSLSGLSAVLLLVGAATTAQAQTATYTGTTTGPNDGHTLTAQAVFSIANNVLTIQLTNTSAALSNRADTLTTVLFSFNTNSGTVVVPANTTNLATTPATTLLPGSSIVSSKGGVAYNGTEALQGAYVFDAQPNSATYNYGVSTAAFSPSTASGDKYAFSGMTGGKAQGNDDFAIAGFGTPTLMQTFPVVQNGIQVVVSGFSNLTSTSQIKNVGFGFASGAVPVGTTQVYVYQIAPGTLQPTPASPGGTAAVLGMAMAMIGRIRSIRRRQKEEAIQTAE